LDGLLFLSWYAGVPEHCHAPVGNIDDALAFRLLKENTGDFSSSSLKLRRSWTGLLTGNSIPDGAGKLWEKDRYQYPSRLPAAGLSGTLPEKEKTTR